jgi:hypothetical protein
MFFKVTATYSLGFEVDIMQFSQDHIIYTREASLSIVMAVLRVYKRNSTFMDLAELVDQISRLGLVDALQKYHNKPLEREAKSIAKLNMPFRFMFSPRVDIMKV